MASYMRLGKQCPVCKAMLTVSECPKCHAKSKPVGSWSVRFRIYVDGKPIYKKLGNASDNWTKAQATQAYDKYKSDHPDQMSSSNIVKDTSKLSYSFLYSKYVEYMDVHLKESTVYDRQIWFPYIIEPYFSKYCIADINKAVIAGYFTYLDTATTRQGKPFSNSSKKAIIRWLRAFMTFCESYYDVPNVMKQIKTPAYKQSKQMKYYTKEEFDRFLSAVDDIKWQTVFVMLYYMGMRCGELRALLEEDIDMVKKTITIGHSILSKTNNKSNLNTRTVPKNESSNRTLPMPDIVYAYLSEWFKYKRSTFPSMCSPKSFLFAGDVPVGKQAMTDHSHSVASSVGLPIIRVHDFRHSCASFLINSGADAMLVCWWLGHSTPNETYRTYSHLFPNRKLDLIDKINTLTKK